jgi:hypothetical protein
VLSGPSSGATVVTVTGTQFLASAFCRFGTALAASVTVSTSTLVQCESPALAVGEYTLEVSNNSQDYTVVTREFRYYCACRVTNVVWARSD